MRMTLKQLAVFAAIAKEGTVTRACSSIMLTQSAASMALHDLESGLGKPLFDRVGKRLQLNALGQHLLPQALEILARCEAFEQAASGEFRHIDLKVGATLTISDYIAPTVISEFLKHNTNAKLQLQVGNTRQIIDAVNQFQLDIGLIEGSCHLPQLEAIPWHGDTLAIVCAPTHPLAQLNRPCTLEDLSHVEWIMREAGSGTREVFDTIVLPNLPHANISLVLGHNEAILKVVASGKGVTCLSNLAIAHMIEKQQLVTIDTPFWSLTRSFFIVMHRQKFQSDGITDFLKCCKTTLVL